MISKRKKPLVYMLTVAALLTCFVGGPIEAVRAAPIPAARIQSMFATARAYLANSDLQKRQKVLGKLFQVPAAHLSAAILESGLTAAMTQTVREQGSMVPAQRSLMKYFSTATFRVLQQALGQDSESAERILRMVSSRRYADAMLAQWMGHEAPGTHVAKSASVMRRLADAGLAQPSVADVKRLAGKLDISRVIALSEQGGSGEANGVVDPGEWVRLQVTITNPTKDPFFSSSAFVQSSECVFVPEEHSEHLLVEMPVAGHATMAFWAYVGPCPKGGGAFLQLMVGDTHHGEHRFELAFKDTKTRAVPTLGSLRHDVDVPGYSQPQKGKLIGPGTRFEMSHTVTVADRARSVDLGYGVPKDARKLVVPGEHAHRTTAMYQVGSGRFAARDDWDGGAVAPMPLYQREFQQLGISRRWFTGGAKGPLWFAADVLVMRDRQGQRPLAAAPPPTPPSGPPSAEALSALFLKNLSFRSREVTPSQDAIGAVAGHDVILNKLAFSQGYDALLKRTPNRLSGARGQAVYSHRFYFQLPLKSGTRPALPSRPAPKPVYRPPPKPAPVAEVAPWLRLDLGVAGGFLLMPDDLDAEDTLFWRETVFAEVTTVTIPEFHLLLTLGSDWAGFIELQGGGAVERNYGVATLSNSQWAGHAGLAYIARFDELEVQPRFGLGIQNRYLTSDNDARFWGFGEQVAEDWFFSAELGATFRVLFTDYFGIHADGSLLLSGEGPNAPRGGGGYSLGWMYGAPLLSGISLHFGGGLTFRF